MDLKYDKWYSITHPLVDKENNARVDKAAREEASQKIAAPEEQAKTNKAAEKTGSGARLSKIKVVTANMLNDVCDPFEFQVNFREDKMNQMFKKIVNSLIPHGMVAKNTHQSQEIIEEAIKSDKKKGPTFAELFQILT